MTSNYNYTLMNILAALLTKVTAENSESANCLKAQLGNFPETVRKEILQSLRMYKPDIDISSLCKVSDASNAIPLLSSDKILKEEWPEAKWVVPDIIPEGLSLLAGAPKIGKSWFALQINKEITTGGSVFGKQVERGRVLHMALEDPPRRLQQRMLIQKWSEGLAADFLTVGYFFDHIGDLRKGGGEKLAQLIKQYGYRLVTIDTLSRAIRGDQNDMQEMTEWLTPLQECAHENNCAIVMIDHHRKANGFDPDPIADILGSTGKGAMADTVLGLYRERGQSVAKLQIIGRDAGEATFSIKMDWQSGCWQLDTSEEGITDQQDALLDVLEVNGPTKTAHNAKTTGINKGTVHHQLVSLEKKGK